MTDADSPIGHLVMVPNALDHGTGIDVPLDAVLPALVIARAACLTQWVVEDARSARTFLKRVSAHVPLARPLQEVVITVLPRAGKPEATRATFDIDGLLAPTRRGQDVGLLSEAGLPALADPGAALVAAAHAAGIVVETLPGPSSIALAVAASGLHGQAFCFVGYLPVESAARARRIRDLQDESMLEQRTIVAIEAPYRNRQLLDALVEHLSPTTLLGVACGLTLPMGSSVTRTIAQWRGATFDFPPDHPAVFSWLASRVSGRSQPRPSPRDHRSGQDAHGVRGQVRQRRRT